MKHILIFCLFIPVVYMAQDRITGKSFATRSEVLAQNGMACTSQPLATQAAIDILKQGGNAINAVVEPMNCGIGGDLFAIIWIEADKHLYGLNGSGRSPKSLKIETLQGMGLEKIPFRGPLPVTVPGCVDGWFAQAIWQSPNGKNFSTSHLLCEKGIPGY